MKRFLQLLCICLLAGAGQARAQERVKAPSNGLELRLDLGYGQGFGPVASRLPRLQELGKAGGTTVLLPGDWYDPWVGAGFGWRGYWADLNGGTHGLQGLDLARLQLGVDHRLTPKFAIGPVVGLTMTEFLSVEPVGSNSYNDTRDRKLNTFVFGGFSGRFSR